MNFKELNERRYSVRNYLQQPVETEKIDYILACARLAPSACNNQPWKIYVVTDEQKRMEIQCAYNREWFKSAPVYLVVCKDSEQSWKRTATDMKDFGDVDASIISQTICLATAEIGLGACWVCNFDPQILSDALELSDSIEPIAIFPIGYIDIEKSVIPDKKRKDLSDMVQWI